ncbi:hypothetical protein CEXT_337351 [Caerostris extrusa]|uniref:Uncharacterized protein n=1 Tax=Caerostris extrusa TaxID=172846 RepID=A0AAV4PZ95_CAEEX|nr:hypothetical protein CEXT_337351 [Caerostris extrusa]
MQNKRSVKGLDEEKEMPSNLENIKKEESAPTKKFKSSTSELFQETNPANATENIPIPSPETNLSMDSTQASEGTDSNDGFESEIDMLIENYYVSDTSVAIESHECTVNCYNEDTILYDVNDTFPYKTESHDCSVNCYSDDTESIDVNEHSGIKIESHESSVNCYSEDKRSYDVNEHYGIMEENSANAIEKIFLPSAETNLSMDNAGASGAIGSTDDLLPAVSVERPRPKKPKVFGREEGKRKLKHLYSKCETKYHI